MQNDLLMKRRAKSTHPWWSYAVLAGLVVLAALLYTWALSRNGMGNDYYAAAVKSASVSWKAFLFGSLDPGSFITLDKPPLALMLQALSARVFGFSSWSMLLPQALAGIVSVLIVYRLVRRWSGDIAAALAGLAMALTPVAVVMFRFNNPDALLTLVLLLAAWAFWSALEKGSTWKLAGAGALIGLAFTTKMLEAFVILPAFVLVYLVCGKGSLIRRGLQLLGAAAAVVVAGGWWVAVAELWPIASRPYIGGTSNNSVLGLIFSRSAGYLGGSGGAGAPRGPSGPAFFAGSAGWLRMFNNLLGGQISWLIPLALLGLVAGLYQTARRPRTDLARAGFLLWGSWTLLFVGIFSGARGVLHPYYTVVLAPSLAALLGGGSVALWRISASRRWLAWLLPAGVAGTGVWSAALLNRTPGYLSGLAVSIEVCTAIAAVLLAIVLARLVRWRTLMYGAAGLAVVGLLAGPFAYAISTVSRSVTGPFAAAGPGDSYAFGSPMGGTSPAGMPGGFPDMVTGAALEVQVDDALISYLVEHRGTTKFLVAVQGSQVAIPIILATSQPVIAMGGFGGGDPTPTLTELQGMVSAGLVHYVLLSGTRGFPGGAFPGPPGAGTGQTPGLSQAGRIAQWVGQRGTEVPSSEINASSQFGVLYYLQ